MTGLICDETRCAHNLMGRCRCGTVRMAGAEAYDASMTGCMSFVPHYSSLSRSLDGIYAGLSGEFGTLHDGTDPEAYCRSVRIDCLAHGCAFNDGGICAHPGHTHVLARRASATGGIAQCSSFLAK